MRRRYRPFVAPRSVVLARGSVRVVNEGSGTISRVAAP